MAIPSIWPTTTQPPIIAFYDTLVLIDNLGTDQDINNNILSDFIDFQDNFDNNIKQLILSDKIEFRLTYFQDQPLKVTLRDHISFNSLFKLPKQIIISDVLFLQDRYNPLSFFNVITFSDHFDLDYSKSLDDGDNVIVFVDEFDINYNLKRVFTNNIGFQDNLTYFKIPPNCAP